MTAVSDAQTLDAVPVGAVVLTCDGQAGQVRTTGGHHHVQLAGWAGGFYWTELVRMDWTPLQVVWTP